MNMKLDDFLDQARMLLSNARNHAGIRQQLGQYGYGTARFNEAEALLQAAYGLTLQQEDAYSLAHTTGQRLKEDIRAAQAAYRELVEITRFAFREDKATLRYLRLNESRKTNQTGWHRQAQAFYERLSQHVAALKKYNITPERIVQAQAMVQAVVDGRHQRQQQQADAQRATRQRNDALKALEAWVRDFRKVAGVALKNHPQWEEALGKVVPS